VVAVGNVFVAAASLAIALFFFFAAFLPADFNFRLRIAFLVVALRLLGMLSPLVKDQLVRRSLRLASVLQPRHPGLQP
jgi:hypothetical protein